MMQQGFLRNLKLYPYYRVLSSLMIIGPILVPFMLWKGLSYSQIMLLQSISAISVFIFEVPTGAIADKVSRKFSLVISEIICVTGLSFYVIFNSFFMFALAELLFGLGMTFASGADSAILYESLVKLDKRKEYQRYEGNAASYIFLTQALGSVISGFLYVKGETIPFWISVGFLASAGIVSIFFVDTGIVKSEHSYFRHIIKSVGYALNHPRILWAILFAFSFGFFFRSSYWMYQPYFADVSIDVKWFGIIYFGFNIVAALSSKYLVHRFYDERPRRVLIWLCWLMVVSFLVPALLHSPIMLILLALQQVVRGLKDPTLRFYINHNVEDNNRATVISLVSLAGSLGFALFAPFVGKGLDNSGT
ncbi:MAG: MFS transporter, partial [Candidatus Cloacimonetes bacterium]|nr:MFS transporter [Candidatus Cloacimonadota bacterium]